MTPLFWIGTATFIAGGAIWFTASRPGGARPRWLRRLGAGMMALGLSTLSLLQPGQWWAMASIAFSVVAIVLIVLVLRDILRVGR